MNGECASVAFFPPYEPVSFLKHSGYRRIFFAMILVLAAGLRFIGLDQYPPGLFRDEAEKGYNAWALATAGGVIEVNSGEPGDPPARFKRWPWMIGVLGTQTSAIYQYIDAPFVGLGGLTVANTRRAAALGGTLAVLVMGLIAMRIWGAAPGLLIALWLALSPWHIVFSRWAQQSAFVPALLACALGGCWGIERETKWGWPVLGAALGWLFYDYSGAQPFVLAWGPALIWIYRRRINLKSIWPWSGLLLFALPVIPTLIVTLGPHGSQRLSQVALWSGNDQNFFHLLLKFLRNYIVHFSPDFLFLRGEAQPRHSIPGMGMLLWVDALLLPVGLCAAFKGKLPMRWPVLAAMLCGPLSAAITKNSPHALRSLPEALPCVIWAGLGLWSVMGWTYKKLIVRGCSGKKAALWVSCLLFGMTGMGLSGFVHYLRFCKYDPGMGQAFQQTMRLAWEELASRQKPEETLYYNVFFPYAPYFQFFYLRIPPERAARGDTGPQRVIYFDPRIENVIPIMKSGDWILTPLKPDDAVILEFAGMKPERARQIGEYWARLKQR